MDGCEDRLVKVDFLCIYFYLFMKDREAETQAGGEAGSMQEAWTRDPGITS